MRVLVLGGTGNFGSRIVRALHNDPAIELVAAARRVAPVPGAEAVPVVPIDVGATDLPARIAAQRPGLVIHCVGPFQRQDYRVAAAALSAGAHYLDLADGREFVARFAADNHALASHAGRAAISGASTLPALSAAVIEALSEPMQSLQAVDIAIAPGQRAARGAATFAAVLSYLGRPIPVWRDGRWQMVSGWMDVKRIGFAFGKRWGAACDVPDLALLPEIFPELESVRFHAALEIGLQHFVLWHLAAVRRLGLPLPVERWSGALDRLAAKFDRFAGNWGGMRLSVAGKDRHGSRLRRTWQLTAPALDGPEVPCMPAILLARRLARGDLRITGAFHCMGFLKLADFEPEFARWGITTAIEERAA